MLLGNLIVDLRLDTQPVFCHVLPSKTKFLSMKEPVDGKLRGTIPLAVSRKVMDLSGPRTPDGTGQRWPEAEMPKW